MRTVVWRVAVLLMAYDSQVGIGKGSTSIEGEVTLREHIRKMGAKARIPVCLLLHLRLQSLAMSGGMVFAVWRGEEKKSMKT